MRVWRTICSLSVIRKAGRADIILAAVLDDAPGICVIIPVFRSRIGAESPSVKRKEICALKLVHAVYQINTGEKKAVLNHLVLVGSVVGDRVHAGDGSAVRSIGGTLKIVPIVLQRLL